MSAKTDTSILLGEIQILFSSFRIPEIPAFQTILLRIRV